VLSLIITCCADAYVPPGGENVGVTAAARAPDWVIVTCPVPILSVAVRACGLLFAATEYATDDCERVITVAQLSSLDDVNGQEVETEIVPEPPTDERLISEGEGA
jgi:hypothetical protein